MQDKNSSENYPCRIVTDEEIAHFHEFGWAKLTGFIDPELIHQLLDIARQRMGEDADSNAPREITTPYFNPEFAGGMQNALIRPLLEKIGRSAKALMDRQGDIGVKYFADMFMPKLPASKPSRHGGNGPTSFHQDFITFAVDRTGGMTFWIPLEACGPEKGTMSFVNGSHRMGVLGDYRTYDGDALDEYPELRELEMSEPLSYEVGDISVHTHLTVHGAGANMTDTPRWAYLFLAQPADICWTGAPPEAFDTTGMVPNQKFDDERFPVIA